MKTTPPEILRCSKIIALSIFLGFSFLAFVLGLILKNEDAVRLTSVFGFLCLYLLITQWFGIAPISGFLNWYDKYGLPENPVDDPEELHNDQTK